MSQRRVLITVDSKSCVKARRTAERRIRTAFVSMLTLSGVNTELPKWASGRRWHLLLILDSSDPSSDRWEIMRLVPRYFRWLAQYKINKNLKIPLCLCGFSFSDNVVIWNNVQIWRKTIGGQLFCNSGVFAEKRRVFSC